MTLIGKTRVLGAAALFASILLPWLSSAATLAVPEQFSSIQAALDAAATGDTIQVAPGTYTGSLTFSGKAVSLQSQAGALATTIAGTGDHVITFQDNDRSTVLSGFTIQGTADSSSALVLNSASPSLLDNRFVGGSGQMVAIEAYDSSVLLERNYFTGWNSGGNTNSVVSLNNPVAPTIKDNVFFSNASALYLFLTTGNGADITNNTFANDDADIDIDAYGDENDILIRNNIFYGAQFGVYVNLTGRPFAPVIQNNLAFSNLYNFAGVTDPTGSNGNISVDPQLGGLSATDFHLDSGSPAIDAGINAGVAVGETDFYGAQRIRIGSSGLAIVDIGAVEYVGAQPTVKLDISANSILLGASVTITWSSSNATACTAGGAWSGALALSGTRVVTPTAGNFKYTVRCSNANAIRLQSAALTVYAPPTAQVSASPATVYQNQETTVTWSSTAATSCGASGAWAGPLFSVKGTTQVGFPGGGTYPLTLTCTGPGGTATATTNVTVIPGPTITFSSTDVPAGGTTVLTWSAFPNATACTAEGAWSGSMPISGSQVVGPLAAGNYLFQLTCTAPGVSVPTSQFISVYPPAQFAFENLSFGGTNVAAIAATALPGVAPVDGGLDGQGNAYNGSAIGYSLAALGEEFQLSPSQMGMSNQTVALAPNFLHDLTILATGVNGNQPNQTFVVDYSDGSSSKFVQSLSDWGHPQNYAGESVALVTPFRITRTGAEQTGSYNVYAYRIPVDSQRVVTSLKLPVNRNVVMLGINETIAPQNVTTSVASWANVDGLAADGQGASNGGLDTHGNAYAAALVPQTITSSGLTFSMGSANQLSAVSGGTLQIGSARAMSVSVLATGVNGNQPDQSFLVTYDDGSTTLFTQSLSDWRHPQTYTGESTALSTPYRITATGARLTGPYNLYAYTLALDSTKYLQSLTLPNNRNVVVLAISLLNQQ